MKKALGFLWKLFKFGVKAYIAFAILVVILMAFMINREVESSNQNNIASENRVSGAKQRMQESRSLFENNQLQQMKEAKKILEEIK